MVWFALILAAFFAAPAGASAQTKSLKLYYLHTGEKAVITFKRNGKFDPKGLKKINWFLRDWRRNEPTKMDPNLLDLIWEVYRQSGSKKHIHVISGYRSLKTNNKLRKRGRGVAKNSQHTRGKALDFFLPDVKLSKLRAIGLKLGVGGVGYYPKSGSPFVHMDTGGVRHWPRMSRSQLVKLFPDGKTMHVPTDRKPLKRYKQALAEYKRRKATGTLIPNKKGGGFGNLFARNNKVDDGDENEDSGASPLPRRVATRKIAPIAPVSRPANGVGPAIRPANALVGVAATNVVPPEALNQQMPDTEYASLPRAVPRPVMAPRQNAGAGFDQGTQIPITALAPVAAPRPASAAISQAVADSGQTIRQDGMEIVDIKPLAVQAPTSAIGNLPLPAPRPSGNVNQTIEIARLDAKTDARKNSLANSANMLNQGIKMNFDALPPQTDSMTVSALSPGEIVDLRRTAVRFNNGTGLRPMTAIPGASAEPQNRLQKDIEPIKMQPIKTVSLQAENTPVTQPRLLEPGSASQDQITIPGKNPRGRKNVGSAVLARSSSSNTQSEPSVKKHEQIAALPQHQTRPAVRSANAVQAKQQPAKTQLARRPISLDRFSAPEQNHNQIGNHALASNYTIEKAAQLQAPAYGRNVIRIAPDAIISNGFATVEAPVENSFSGRAITPISASKFF